MLELLATAVEEMIGEIWAGGPLDGLVNNAAGNFISQTKDLSPRAFDAIANIVLHGTFYMTNACGKLMERYEIMMEGIPEEWFSLSLTELRLDPVANSQIPLRLGGIEGPVVTEDRDYPARKQRRAARCRGP